MRVGERRTTLLNLIWSRGLIVIFCTLAVTACERPPIESRQVGYRGTGMVDVRNPRIDSRLLAANQVPVAMPAIPDAGGPRAGDIYSNLQVPALRELGVAQFARLMTSITQWVSPQEGCNYCHIGEDFASDDLYQKVVSRRMLEMTIDINTNWTDHVSNTGVTCYTCHRGEPVPGALWYAEETETITKGFIALSNGQNRPAETAAYSSLPYDPFLPYLEGAEDIRIQPAAALPSATLPGASIQDTERTYALMMHMSDALGVNCTYCHNSRAFSPWESSTPQRVTAWHGIQMARHINVDYIEPLTDAFPPERLGPLGDAPKANCATCHRGIALPLNGVSMVTDFPSLTSVAEE